jgi:hypothetical protein
MANDDDSGAARRGGDGDPAKPSRVAPFIDSWVNRILLLIGIPAAIITAYVVAIRPLWPAQVEAKLASCQGNEIVLKLTNRGGRRAMVQRPTFRIRSTLGPEDVLNMRRIAKSDPFAGWDRNLNPGADPKVLTYPAAGPFFDDAELKAGCHILVSVPVLADRPHDPARDDCRCEE